MGPRHLEAGEEAVVLLLLEGVEEGVGHLLLEVEADRVAVGDLEEREGEVVRHLLPRQDQEEQEGLGEVGRPWRHPLH